MTSPTRLRPLSAPGFLVAALRERRQRGLPPFTVLCCDNLPANGRTVAQGGGAAGQACAIAALGKHIVAENVAFPSTMVDRIVPATTDADRARVAAATGLDDTWPVVTEVYNNWVVEDHFPQGRPAWSATFVDRHRALRADEAAAAQRRAFLHVLSRLSRRP